MLLFEDVLERDLQPTAQIVTRLIIQYFKDFNDARRKKSKIL